MLLQQSSQEVLRLRELLKEKGSQLDTALNALDRATRVQQSLENEKEIDQAVNTKQRQIEELQNDLAIAQAQVRECTCLL